MNLEAIIAARNKLSGAIREFFASRGYLEVETPILVASPDLSPNLTPFQTTLRGADGSRRSGALITSPEFSMKKLLGQGLAKIFTITKVFRNGDFYPEGPSQHNPEFTLLEWYQQGMDYQAGMGETESLVNHCAAQFGSGTTPGDVPGLARVHLPTVFMKVTGFELSDASSEDLQAACAKLGLRTDGSDTWSDLFHRIVVTQIEPHLPKDGAFLYDFPLQQAALARQTPDGKYAERFELYLNGIELCNAFGELTDAAEQRRRFEAEVAERQRLGQTVFPIDEELLRLLPSIRQPTFGNALGVDRLLMVLLGKDNLEEVLVFPAKQLFKPE